MKDSEVNCKCKERISTERHISIRIVVGAISGMLFLCSIVIGTTIYSIEKLKHPMQYENSTQLKRY